MDALILAVAALAGVLLGYLLRNASGNRDKKQNDDRLAEANANLGAVREELVRAQKLAGDRAGFESLAGERAKTIEQLTADRERLQTEVQLQSGKRARPVGPRQRT